MVRGHFTVFVLLRTGHLYIYRDLFLSQKLFLGIFKKFECMKVKYFRTTSYDNGISILGGGECEV